MKQEVCFVDVYCIWSFLFGQNVVNTFFSFNYYRSDSLPNMAHVMFNTKSPHLKKYVSNIQYKLINYCSQLT